MKPIPILLVLLALFVLGDQALAQCPGGTLAFRVVDTRSGDIRPRVSDLPGSRVESMEIAGMRIDLRTIERSLEISLDTGYYAGGSPVFQSLNPRGLRQAFLGIDRGGERMEILITNVAPGACFLLDSIPFRSGYWTIDLEPARRDERGIRRIDVGAHLRELNLRMIKSDEPLRSPAPTDAGE